MLNKITTFFLIFAFAVSFLPCGAPVMAAESYDIGQIIASADAWGGLGNADGSSIKLNGDAIAMGYNQIFTQQNYAFQATMTSNEADSWFVIQIRGDQYDKIYWDMSNCYYIMLKPDASNFSKWSGGAVADITLGDGAAVFDGKQHLFNVVTETADDGVSVTLYVDGKEVISGKDTAAPLKSDGYLSFAVKSADITVTGADGASLPAETPAADGSSAGSGAATDLGALLGQSGNWTNAALISNGAIQLNGPAGDYAMVGYNSVIDDSSIAFSVKLDPNDADNWLAVQLRANQASGIYWDMQQAYVVMFRPNSLTIDKWNGEFPRLQEFAYDINGDGAVHDVRISLTNLTSGGVEIKVFIDGQELGSAVDEEQPITNTGFMSFVARGNNVVIGAPKSAGGGTAETEEPVQAEAIELPEYLALLSALNIINADDIGAIENQAGMTRGEFIKLAVSMTGTDTSNLSKILFSDVEQSHPYYPFISAAAVLGIISGDPSGTIRPDDAITYTEAVTVLLNTMQYKSLLQQLGDYPTPYLAKANELGLKKAGEDMNQVTADEAYQMIFTALNAPVLTEGGMTTDGSIIYNINEDDTYLAKVRGILKYTGVLCDDGFTSLTGGSQVSKNSMQIGGYSFLNKTANAAAYLGCNVIAYISAKNGETIQDNDEAICVVPYESQNTVEVIDDMAIAANDASFSATKFVYYDEKSRVRSFKVSEDADMIFNRAAYPDFTVKDMQPKTGQVKLIDNNGDGVYEVISVTSYENYWVKSVDTFGYAITDYDGKKLSDLEPDTDTIVSIKRDSGEDMQLSEIKEYDVLSVAQSKNHQYTQIVVSSNTVTGVVEEAGSVEDGESFVVVDGVKYQTELQPDTFTVGYSADLYLDINRKVYRAVVNSSALQYGWLIAAKAGNDFGENVQLKLLTAKNGVCVLEARDRVMVGSSPASAKAVEKNEVLGAVASNQMIKYGTDGNGRISMILLAGDPVDGAVVPPDKDTFTLNYQKGRRVPGDDSFPLYNGSDRSLYRWDNRIQNRFILTASTPVFMIPEPGCTDDDAYEVKNKGYYGYDWGVDNYQIYDWNQDYEVGVMVQFINSGSKSADIWVEAAPLLIDKISTALNADGDTVYKLRGFVSGKEAEFSTVAGKELIDVTKMTSPENINLSDLEKGALVQLNTNAKGEVDGFRTLFLPKIDISKGHFEKSNVGVVDLELQYQLFVVMGKVLDKTRTTFVVNSKDDSTDINYTTNRFLITNNAVVYVMELSDDPEDTRIYISDMGSMEVGDTVISRIDNSMTKEVIILKRR